jgi:choline dehydrogenase-like flavoprotein
VDGSFFVSSGAVNPTLTIIANALRVGDHLLERLSAHRPQEADSSLHPTSVLTSIAEPALTE